MILHFKIDENHRLWLIFCNGLRVLDIEESLGNGDEDICGFNKPCLSAILTTPK